MILFFSTAETKEPTASRFFRGVLLSALILIGVAVTAGGLLAAEKDSGDKDSWPAMFGERTLTVATTVEHTLARDSFRQLTTERKRRAEASVTRARRFPNPVFSYDHEQALGDVWRAENTFVLQQTLPIAGRQSRVEAARMGQRAESLRVQAKRLDVAAEARQNWVEWATACNRYRVRKEYVRRLEAGMRIVDKRVEAGEAPKLDRSRFRSELASTRAALAEAQSRCRAHWSELSAWMGDRTGNSKQTAETDTEKKSPKTEMPRPPAQSRSTLKSPSSLASALESLQSAPALQARQKTAESSAKLAEATKRSRWPDLSIQGGFRSLHSPNGVDPGFVAGISVPLPLWFARRGRMDELQADVGVQRSAYREALRRRRGDLKAAWHRASGLDAALADLRRDGLSAARRAARRARAGYEGGEVRLNTYLETVRELEKIQLRLIELRRSASLHWIRVQRLAGIPVHSHGSQSK